MIGRIARWAALAALLSIIVAGCVTTAPPQEEKTMDHVEAKAQLVALLETAQDAIGGEWERSDAGAHTCTLAAGGDGAAYGLNRLGPGVAADAQQAIVDEVVAAWLAHDVDAVASTLPEVEGVIVTQVRYPATDVDSDGFFVQLWVSERASTVGGQTRCATGDAAEINTP